MARADSEYKCLVDSEAYLKRWTAAGLLDDEAAARIRAWESNAAKTSEGLRWPVIAALVCGAILLAAGVLLFVSAHWDQLSPDQRLALVLLMVGVFHVSGAAVAQRFEGLSIALHTVGTFALGAGIGLAGQIYNLSSHWPTAILLWALGAGAAWALLRHWTQGALFAILLPTWLLSEWGENFPLNFDSTRLAVLGLSIAYFTALNHRTDSAFRKSLGWIGGIALIPAVIAAAIEITAQPYSRPESAFDFSVVIVVPLGLAYWFRRRAAVWNVGAALWSLILVLASAGHAGHWLLYAWCAIGSIGLISWGVAEQRAERINLGMIGFAITVLSFYFSDVMDKLDRSLSLIVLGAVFLGGGWFLERARRRLVAQIHPEAVQ